MNKNILLKFDFQVYKEKINDNLSITVFPRLPIPICNTRFAIFVMYDVELRKRTYKVIEALTLISQQRQPGLI